MKEFLFNYRFDGADWGTSVFAENEAQAREKIKAQGMARYEGELAMRIPAYAGAGGLIPSLVCWLRNRFVR